MHSPRVERAWQVLEGVTDPEIPVVNLRELGILREVRELEDGEAGELEVVITPTYSGCPAMDQIGDDVRHALQAAGLPARLHTRLSPPWTTDWITPQARQKLRDYGIAPPAGEAADEARPLQFTRRRAALAVACPRCGSGDTTEVSHFGSTACKALYRCLACLEPFDHFKPY